MPTTRKPRFKKTGTGKLIRKNWEHLAGGRRRPGEAAFDATILLRLYSADRALIERAATKAGMSLSGFLRDKCVLAAQNILGVDGS